MNKMNAQLSIRRDGVVYTPKKLAEYVAKKTLQYVLDDDYFVARNQRQVIQFQLGFSKKIGISVVNL